MSSLDLFKELHQAMSINGDPGHGGTLTSWSLHCLKMNSLRTGTMPHSSLGSREISWGCVEGNLFWWWMNGALLTLPQPRAAVTMKAPVLNHMISTVVPSLPDLVTSGTLLIPPNVDATYIIGQSRGLDATVNQVLWKVPGTQ